MIISIGEARAGQASIGSTGRVPIDNAGQITVGDVCRKKAPENSANKVDTNENPSVSKGQVTNDNPNSSTSSEIDSSFIDNRF